MSELSYLARVEPQKRKHANLFLLFLVFPSERPTFFFYLALRDASNIPLNAEHAVADRGTVTQLFLAIGWLVFAPENRPRSRDPLTIVYGSRNRF